ncbi:MAG: AAA family ATPase, partial [Anaerolineales bacterium]
MPRLSLALLGLLEARLADQAVHFPTRKTFALLIYLAAAPGPGPAGHGRESLMALLWPDSDAPHAQASLRNTLARLRQSLPAAAEPYLLVSDESVALNFDSDYELDLDALSETAVARGSLDALETATQKYRGEFLSGYNLPDVPEFEAWTAGQREYWRRQQCHALERLARLQAESGDSSAALATGRRWAATDPLNEAAYQALMRLQFASGDKGGALETYAAGRAALARELGVGPSPETEALAARIRRETAAAPARSRAPEGPAELPFVGRAVEYARLIELYHSAAAGRAQLAIIEGEAGIGKTRLAGEFLAWAAAQGGDVLRGRAFEAGGRLPYQPIVEAIRARLERENAPDDLLDDAWLAELSRLLPELRERYPDLPPAQPEEALAAGRLMEAVARLTLALATRRPLIFFLDDLQWADTASL